MPRPFLTAEWMNLILANYPVPESLLRKRLPPGLEPDRRDGECWCSLVGFQFRQTRVLGIGWPGFRNFTEWNLRCYVRHGDNRGVIFVRELVKSRWISWVARTIYNEPYRSCEIGESIGAGCAEYWVDVGGRRHRMIAHGENASVPSEASAEHWFTDQAWGYGMTHRGQLARYNVQHPQWQVYRVRESQIDVDWARLYGDEWACMNAVAVASVAFAVGSAVAVFPNAVIEKTL